MHSAIVKYASIAGSAEADADTPQLSADQIAALRRDGFLKVDGLSTAKEMESLRSVYDRLFSERRGWDTGDLFDMVGPDDDQKQLAIPQMLWPSRYEPSLRQTRLAANAEMIARQILGEDIENFLEHAILKAPFSGTETPWHQDQAFSRKGSGFVESISIWMPLQDVTVESGCMRYITASNHGPLYPHQSPHNDPRIHGLELISPPDLNRCVTVPAAAGSGIIHLSYTIHGAGGNNSSQPRRAYVLGYAVKVRRHQLMTRDYSWNEEKQTAREQRELRSLPLMKRATRRVRRLLRDKRF